MMHYKSKIEPVFIFEAQNGLLVYGMNNGLVVNDFKYDVNPSLVLVNASMDSVLVKSESWEDYCIDIESKQIEKLPFHLCLNGKIKDKVLIRDDNGVAVFGIKEHQVNERLEEILNFKYYFFYNENIIFLDDETVSLYSDSIIIWKKKLCFGTIKKLLGIVNGRLWVTCYLKESVTKDYHTLIALDVKTGEIIFSRNDMDHFHSSACVLNESENTIISLSVILDQTFLMELDALNGEIKRDEQLTDLEQKGFVLGLANSFTLFNNQLYIVVADVKTIFGKSIAILNLKDLKVVWSSKITEGKVSLAQDPQVTDTHLYVLDTYNTLHIFEKESM